MVFSLISCSNSKQCKCTTPPESSGRNSASLLNGIVNSGSLPGIKRVWNKKVNSPKEGYEGLKATYPEYSKRVECFTKSRGFFFFSIRPEEGEDAGEPNCSYSLVIYIKKGDSTFRYFWTNKR